jgi:transketolase
MQIEQLQKKALEIRRGVIECAYKAGNCHVGGALSTIDLLTALYYKVMMSNPQNPYQEDRDRFILSKGHSALGLYVILADRMYFSSSHLDTYKKIGSILQGHPDIQRTPGIEMSAGSLGQGISYGVGKALALRLKKSKSKVYVMVGDGELQEGQNWEAIASAYHFNLENLIVIVDHNKLQLDGTLEKKLSYRNIGEKFLSFGWQIKEIDGHNMREILKSFQLDKIHVPTAIIAHTIKGKGISFMENEVRWHCGTMDPKQYAIAIKELGISREGMKA